VIDDVDNNTHLRAIFKDSLVSWYQNVSVVDYIGAKDDGGGGGGNWNHKTSKAADK